MVVVKLKCKAKINDDGSIEPDLPEHHFKWRINSFDELTGEFEVITELEDENEAEKLKDYIDDEFLQQQEQKIAAVKQFRAALK